MKHQLIVFTLLIFSVTMLNAQEKPSTNNKFRSFGRAELSYVFGITDVYNKQNVNSLHVKLVIGTANPITGFGIGIENASYRSADGSGLSFETLNFSANVHVLAKPIYTENPNFFIKAAAGYAPRIFRGYNKGCNYEIATGILLTNKKRSKYFLQAIYQYQEIEEFFLINGRPKIKAVGLGVGTWF